MCPIGTYANATGTPVCNTCPQGFYCPDPHLSPIPCPAGTATTITYYYMLNNYYYYYYSLQSPLSSTNSPTGSRCYPCPAGYYANQTGLAQCTYCPAGSYCPIKTAMPIQCPPGSYSDNSTAFNYGDTCLTCPANTYTLSNGSTSCLACPNGKICPDPTRAPITIPLGILITFQRSFDIFYSILL